MRRQQPRTKSLEQCHGTFQSLVELALALLPLIAQGGPHRPAAFRSLYSRERCKSSVSGPSKIRKRLQALASAMGQRAVKILLLNRVTRSGGTLSDCEPQISSLTNDWKLRERFQ